MGGIVGGVTWTPRVRRSAAVADQVYRSLREGILARHWKPGDRLIESEIATMFDVSRTPVREAVRRLDIEGLVERSRQGVAVADLHSQLADLYGLRRRLEGYAAYLAASRITSGELTDLEGICEETLTISESGELPRRAAMNKRFHRIILAAARSKRLDTIQYSMPGYFLDDQMVMFYDYDTETAEHIYNEHLDIIGALRESDSGKAELLTNHHFDNISTMVQGIWVSRCMVTDQSVEPLVTEEA